MSDRYEDFFFGDKSDVIEYETFEITHPNFTQSYYFVRNATEGLQATTEEPVTRDFVYTPCLIERSGSAPDLDFGIRITFGDLGEILPAEMEAVRTAAGFDTYPTVKYRTFASDTLGVPMQGPFTLYIYSFAFNREGAIFECRPQITGTQKTGRLFTLEDFPTLRGYAQ